MIKHLSVILAIIKNKVEARRIRKKTISLMVDFSYSELIEAMDRGEPWAIEFTLNKWG